MIEVERKPLHDRTVYTPSWRERCLPWRHCDHRVGVYVALRPGRCRLQQKTISVQGVECCLCDRTKAQDWGR